MKGYKATNGNYITGKDIQQIQKRFKQLKAESQIKAEHEQQLKEVLVLAEIREEKRLQEQYKKDKEIFVSEAKTFLEYISKNFNYQMYLIGWDICNNSYYQIEGDLQRNKINKDMIKSIYEVACKMFSKLEFNIESIAGI